MTEEELAKETPTEIHPKKRSEEELAAHKKHIAELASKIDITNPNSVEQFGLNLQSQTRNVAQQVLENAKARDLGPIKKDLVTLTTNMQMLPDDQENKGLFHRLFRKGKQTGLEWYNSTLHVQGLVNTVSDALKEKAKSLQKSNEVNQAMFDDNGKLYNILSDHIEAGEQALDNVRTAQLPALQKEIDSADSNSKPVMQQKYQLVSQNVSRLQKRIADLASIRQMVYTTGPELLLIRNSNQLLIDQINDAIDLKIPAWEKALGVHMSVMDQKAALDMKKDFDDKTDKLLKDIANEIHDNSVDIVKSSGDTAIKMETLQDINDTILDTVKDCNQAAIDAEKNQREAIKKIKAMTTDFQKTLSQINQDNIKRLEDTHKINQEYLLNDKDKQDSESQDKGYTGIDWNKLDE